MALVLTPDVFLDLMRLCLTWGWESAVDRARASHNREQPLHATQLGWTTVDKIVRILSGLDIVNKKQRSLLHKDRRTQHLVLRNSDIVAPGVPDLSSSLQNSKKIFVLQHDLVESVNREKMLCDMRFYITARGQGSAKILSGKYVSSITKERYFAEIERQNELFQEKNKEKMGAVMNNYRKKVAEQTSGK